VLDDRIDGGEEKGSEEGGADRREHGEGSEREALAVARSYLNGPARSSNIECRYD